MIIEKDIGIIGAGPAGMSCALYLCRSKYSFEIIEKEMTGGKLNVTTEIENYPGVNKTDGFSLGMVIKKQIESFGIKILKDSINDIVFENNKYKLLGEKNTYLFKNIVIATGSSNKKSNAINEDKYLGNGISYCAVCDGFLYKNKDVMVFANSRKGYLEALYLSQLVNKIYLVSDKDEDDVEGSLKKLKSLNNVEFLSPYKIKKYDGDVIIKNVEIENINTKEVKTINISACFPFLGDTPNNYLIKKLGIYTNKSGYILVDKYMETNVKGVYAIGDIIDKPLRQVVTACSDGAIAATSIIKNLNK